MSRNDALVNHENALEAMIYKNGVTMSSCHTYILGIIQYPCAQKEGVPKSSHWLPGLEQLTIIGITYSTFPKGCQRKHTYEIHLSPPKG